MQTQYSGALKSPRPSYLCRVSLVEPHDCITGRSASHAKPSTGPPGKSHGFGSTGCTEELGAIIFDVNQAAFQAESCTVLQGQQERAESTVQVYGYRVCQAEAEHRCGDAAPRHCGHRPLTALPEGADCSCPPDFSVHCLFSYAFLVRIWL